MFKLAFALLAAALPFGAQAQNSIADIAIGSADHTTLVKAVSAAGIVEIFQDPLLNSTLFAPTDAAFAALGAGVVEKYLEEQWLFHLLDLLTYHVTWGQYMSKDLYVGAEAFMYNAEFVNITSLDPPTVTDQSGASALIDPADIEADNGVVHVIDKVLLPYSATNDIVDAVLSSPNHTTLASLVASADLVAPLQSEGPFTLFAPINEAFAALDNATLDYLTSPEGLADLQNALTYHVAEGIYTYAMLEPGVNEIQMLNGPNLYIEDPLLGFNMSGMLNMTMDDDDHDDNLMLRRKRKNLRTRNLAEMEKNMTDSMEIHGNEHLVSLNGGQARILIADILVSNGVIHVIDNIVSPVEEKPDSVGEEISDFVEDIVDFVEDVIDEVVEAAENPDGGGM